MQTSAEDARRRIVRGDWAQFGKQAGDTTDYHIVAASTDPARADQVARRGIVGTPSGPAEGKPEALPWVVIAGGTTDDPYLSIAVTTAATLLDAFDRPVAMTNILWVDWAQATQAHLNGTTLAGAHVGLQWPQATPPRPKDPGLIQADANGVAFPAPAFGAASVAADIDNLVGFRWACAVVGALLDGVQVVIVPEREPLPDTSTRLAAIDAICALLPYGFRAGFSSATWASSLVEHGMRLSFGTRAGKGQRAIPWRGDAPVPRQPPSAAYVDTLLRLRFGEAGRTTQEIVEHLLGEVDPARCRSAVSMRQYLALLDQVREAYRDIINGRGSVAAVAHVLHGRPVDNLPTEYTQAFVQFLVDRLTDQAARQLLAQLWRHDPDTGPRLGAYARGLLSTDNIPLLTSWLALAKEVSAAAPIDLLRAMLHPTERQRAESLDAAGAAVGLIGHVNGAVNNPDVNAVVATQPLICLELLLAALNAGRSRQELQQMISSWRTGATAGTRGWLDALAFAAGIDTAASPQDAASLLQVRDDAWYTLMKVGAAGGQSSPVLRAVSPWLVSRVRAAADPVPLLRSVAAVAAGMAASDVALIDMLHLIGEGRLPNLSIDRAYLDGLKAAWAELNGMGTVGAPTVINALLAAPASGAEMERAMYVVDVALPELRPHLAQRIAATVDADPATFGNTRFTSAWIQNIREFSSFGRFWQLRELTELIHRDGPVPGIVANLAAVRQAGVDYPAERFEAELFTRIPHWQAERLKELLVCLVDNKLHDYANLIRKQATTDRYGPHFHQRWTQFVADEHGRAEAVMDAAQEYLRTAKIAKSWTEWFGHGLNLPKPDKRRAGRFAARRGKAAAPGAGELPDPEQP